MITISIKMKTDEYTSILDKLFVEISKMIKIDNGKYQSNKDVVMSCYNSAEELMKRDWFRNNVLSMVWKIGKDPEEDLVKHFNKRIAEGKINVVS